MIKPVRGRLAVVSPKHLELVCLNKSLLINFPGPKLFEHCRTVNGILYDNFYAAAVEVCVFLTQSGSTHLMVLLIYECLVNYAICS